MHSPPVFLRNLAAGILLGASISTANAASVVINGSFTGSLSPWIPEGQIANTGGIAAFSDESSARLALFQTAAVPGDTIGITVSFDVLNGLSASTPPGTLRDTFFATIYLGKNPFGPSIDGAAFDAVLPLFDLDSSGPFNAIDGAVFGPSPKGAGWTRFQLTRTTQGDLDEPAFLTIAFELFDQNSTPGDSTAAVDHVEITIAVPEPASALAAIVGFALASTSRRCGRAAR
jgi:hypothetical protein